MHVSRVTCLLLATWLTCLLPRATCLHCYTCTGKKNQCASSADPGQETDCPSVFSLIRPSVMLALGTKYFFETTIFLCSYQIFFR